MEMQEISTEKENNGEDEGASEQVVDVKTQEEAETEHYSKLKSPSENVYAETFYTQAPLLKRQGKQEQGNVRLYRALCLFLGIVCLVLLVMVIILGVKLQTGSPVCSEGEETSAIDRKTVSPTCSLEACQHQFPNIKYKRLGCQQCADGWVPYGRSCFFLSTFRLTWANSQLNCSSSGGSLAVISSQNVQDFLTKKGNLKYWIGLRQTDTKWKWINNTELQKSYWSEPSADGDCAFLNSQSSSEENWVKANCRQSTYFICQLQM